MSEPPTALEVLRCIETARDVLIQTPPHGTFALTENTVAVIIRALKLLAVVENDRNETHAAVGGSLRSAAEHERRPAMTSEPDKCVNCGHAVRRFTGGKLLSAWPYCEMECVACGDRQLFIRQRPPDDFDPEVGDVFSSSELVEPE